jgi:hypothetical protein
MDMVSSSHLIDACKLRLQSFRENATNYHSDWYDEAVELARKLNTEPSIPRRCARQTHRENVPASTPAEYYLRCLTIPFLGSDHKHVFNIKHKFGNAFFKSI